MCRAATLPLRGSASALSQGAAPTLARPVLRRGPRDVPKCWPHTLERGHRQSTVPRGKAISLIRARRQRRPRGPEACGESISIRLREPVGRWLFLLFLRAWCGPDVLASQGGWLLCAHCLCLSEEGGAGVSSPPPPGQTAACIPEPSGLAGLSTFPSVSRCVAPRCPVHAWN